MARFFRWDRTAANNATADPTINWAEGQAPSSVNDSARAMMAATATYRDDMSGFAATGGTSTAYTLTSYQVFVSLDEGIHVGFNPHTTNGASPTIAVDGLSAKAIRYAPGVDLPSGVLVQGTPYLVTYFASNGGEWILHHFFNNPYNIPIGGLLPYTGSTAPNSSFVLPYGQAISRTTYATYFSLVGTTFGIGDGSSTFNVPDLRGRAIFGLDNMGGSAASRITVAGGNFDGTSLGAAGGAQNYTQLAANMPAHTHTISITDPGHTHSYTLTNTNNVAAAGPGATANQSASASTTGSNTTGITATASTTAAASAHTILSPGMVLPFILRII